MAAMPHDLVAGVRVVLAVPIPAQMRHQPRGCAQIGRAAEPELDAWSARKCSSRSKNISSGSHSGTSQTCRKIGWSMLGLGDSLVPLFGSSPPMHGRFGSTAMSGRSWSVG